MGKLELITVRGTGGTLVFVSSCDHLCPQVQNKEHVFAFLCSWMWMHLSVLGREGEKCGVSVERMWLISWGIQRHQALPRFRLVWSPGCQILPWCKITSRSRLFDVCNHVKYHQPLSDLLQAEILSSWSDPSIFPFPTALFHVGSRGGGLLGTYPSCFSWEVGSSLDEALIQCSQLHHHSDVMLLS